MKKDGGCAFPQLSSDVMGNGTAYHYTPVGREGMTLRDWFAGQALTGAIGVWLSAKQKDMDEVAKACYRIADAMLKAREES